LASARLIRYGDWVKQRLQALITRYGTVAVWTYFVIFFLVLAGFAVAITLGMDVDSAASSATTIGAAWVATKITQPLRIAATLVLTPFVARGVDAVRGRKNNEPDSPA
jgi:hypothetical protein